VVKPPLWAQRDYSRIDFIVENDDQKSEPLCLFFLEINTLPGFTFTSLYPDAAKAASLSMPELSRRLALQAWTRRNQSKPNSWGLRRWAGRFDNGC